MTAVQAASRKRLRVGVDFHVWDGIFQGSRSHILGLYREAIRRAPDMDFVFFLGDTASLAAAHPEFRLPNVQLVKLAHTSAPVRLALQLPWLQLRHRLDVLHMQYRLPFVRFGACALTVHDILFETHPEYFSPSFVWQSRITYRMATRAARAIFSVSQFSRGELARLYGVDAARVTVTYNGVDRGIFHPGPDGQDSVRELGLEPGGYLLTVGRLEPRKNHATLVRAYARLPADAPPLVIVGQRDFSFSGLFDAIDELGLSGRVRVLEGVTDRQLPAVMRHALIFAYPAFAEGFGMPVAEAMASGVPVITSDTTSLPEVAGNGALLVDPSSEEALAAAMTRLLGDAGLRRQVVEAALRQVEKFDWGSSADALISRLRREFV